MTILFALKILGIIIAVLFLLFILFVVMAVIVISLHLPHDHTYLSDLEDADESYLINTHDKD